MILNKDKALILQTQDQNIKDCIDFRVEWEKNARKVELSYKGMKYPQVDDSKAGSFRNDPTKPVIVNLLKRQHRGLQNYFLNNEPQIKARATMGMDTKEIELSQMLLRRDFVESDFYEEDLDNITNYGLKRGIIWVLALMNPEGKAEVSVADSMDTFVDITAQRKSNIRFYIKTFTKNVNECKLLYKKDFEDQTINWDEVVKENEQTKSTEKKLIIKEPTNKNIIMFREGWYLDEQDGKQVLVKVLTTKSEVIKKVIYDKINFLPVTYYAPVNDPDSLYIDSWYIGILPLEKQVNNILSRFMDIVNTGGRYMYVKEGTRLTRGNNKLLNSLGIEVIQVGKAQSIPQQAELLTITNSQMEFLRIAMTEAEKEGGLIQDIMGSSSLGSEASGRAIEALQAGSKNNVGMAMIELNKFLNRLAKIYFKLYAAGGGEEVKVFNDQLKTEVKIDTSKLGIPNIHIDPRSAFDDITKKADSIQMLEYMQKLGHKVSSDIIAKIYGVDNDLAKDIYNDMKQNENPHIKLAEAQIAILMQGGQVAVSETDDHQIHMSLLGKLLSEQGKKLPEQLMKNIIDTYNTHKAYMGGEPSDDEHRKE